MTKKMLMWVATLSLVALSAFGQQPGVKLVRVGDAALRSPSGKYELYYVDAEMLPIFLSS